jgi:NAD(P)-dependent dehydrogenase (short-subunit alcohol dehydrogenase family)
MTNYLIVGASRGLGLTLAQSLPRRGDGLWAVSRSPPPESLIDGKRRNWIECDLSSPTSAIEQIEGALGTRRVDVLVYCAGIWETTGFLAELPEVLERIIAVNLTAPILLCQRLLQAEKVNPRGKIIFIGSTSGLDNEGSRSVAYASSKAGLRTAAFAIREVVRDREIAVTCISPGSIASGKADAATQSPDRIATSDIADLIRTIVSLSSTSCVKEIVVPAMRDADV